MNCWLVCSFVLLFFSSCLGVCYLVPNYFCGIASYVKMKIKIKTTLHVYELLTGGILNALGCNNKLRRPLGTSPDVIRHLQNKINKNKNVFLCVSLWLLLVSLVGPVCFLCVSFGLLLVSLISSVYFVLYIYL